MDWTILVVALVAVGVVLWIKRAGQIAPDRAAELLSRKAPVIDVRSPEEFSRDAIPGAINIPQNRLATDVPQLFPDKEQPLLLHCLSGGRSMVGTRTLKSLGYRNVHNLGSLGRARRLVEANQ
jgi:phage shock protein E